MSGYNALLLTSAEGGLSAAWQERSEADLGDGDVTVRVTHSTINYKDGLVLTGRLPGMRLPLVPGVDFAGTVTASSYPGLAVGDDVVLNGWGCGERRPGRLRRAGARAWRLACEASKYLHPRRDDGHRHRWIHGDAGGSGAGGDEVTPDKGPVLVTGAAGGVGSVAVALLHKLGYRVIAATGRAAGGGLPARTWRLGDHRARGAVVARTAARQGALGRRHRRRRLPHAGQRPGDDAYGGLRRHYRPRARPRPPDVGGAVHPTRHHARRHRQRHGTAREARARLGASATDLDRAKLAEMTVVRPLSDVVALAPEILAGKVRGRVVLEVG